MLHTLVFWAVSFVALGRMQKKKKMSFIIRKRNEQRSSPLQSELSQNVFSSILISLNKEQLSQGCLIFDFSEKHIVCLRIMVSYQHLVGISFQKDIKEGRKSSRNEYVPVFDQSSIIPDNLCSTFLSKNIQKENGKEPQVRQTMDKSDRLTI